MRKNIYSYAERALVERGYVVEKIKGRGIRPGAQLRASKDRADFLIAVRTSASRKVGLLRTPSGSWKTIDRVHEVVVVAPAFHAPQLIEVLGFDANVICAAFDNELSSQITKMPNLSKKAPIFLSLDETQSSRLCFLGLRKLARWSMILATDEQRLDIRESFVQRVTREFAELNGVDVSRVRVEFHILPTRANARAAGSED